MWSRDEDGLPADAVHVDAGARLQVVQMDVAVLGDEEHHVLLGAYLSPPKKKETPDENILTVNGPRFKCLLYYTHSR